MAGGESKQACPVTAALELIGAKWKMLILHQLLDGTKRFGELQKLLLGITQKMLAARLRELERDKLISRKVYPVVPPKVEYSLTELGQSLESLIAPLKVWGENWLEAKQKQKKLRKKTKN